MDALALAFKPETLRRHRRQKIEEIGILFEHFSHFPVCESVNLLCPMETQPTTCAPRRDPAAGTNTQRALEILAARHACLPLSDACRWPTAHRLASLWTGSIDPVTLPHPWVPIGRAGSRLIVAHCNPASRNFLGVSQHQRVEVVVSKASYDRSLALSSIQAMPPQREVVNPLAAPPHLRISRASVFSCGPLFDADLAPPLSQSSPQRLDILERHGVYPLWESPWSRYWLCAHPADARNAEAEWRRLVPNLPAVTSHSVLCDPGSLRKRLVQEMAMVGSASQQ